MRLKSIKSTIRGTPMEGVAVRLMALQRPELRQDYEWGKRIKRDSEAMRRIIYREVRGADTAIDVGANIGELSEWFFEAAPRGNHHLVEPLPDLAADLRRRFPLAVVHECALSDTNGKAEFFHVVEAHGWSGLHRQDVVADKKTVSISVGVRRLDELVESASIKLIKIDVEGAELGVLRGAERLLGRDRPIILFEHASIHADAYGTSSEQVWTLLAEAGYLLAPVSEESRVLNLDEFRALNERSQRNNYNRHAHTNWVARPR